MKEKKSRERGGEEMKTFGVNCLESVFSGE